MALQDLRQRLEALAEQLVGELEGEGLGPERLWSVDASPGGLSEIEYHDGWVTVHRMNTLAHLDGGAGGAP